VADLVEDREAVVEQVVEHLVEETAGTAGEELLAEPLVRLAACEQPRHGQKLAVRKRDEVVLPDEDVELRGVQPLDGLVVDGEVKDREQVPLVLVVVDLRALALRDDVLDVERMPAEPLGERLRGIEIRPYCVHPHEPAGGELRDLRRARDDVRAGARPGAPADAGQARHGD
jgi:hypothetical protein